MNWKNERHWIHGYQSWAQISGHINVTHTDVCLIASYYLYKQEELAGKSIVSTPSHLCSLGHSGDWS